MALTREGGNRLRREAATAAGPRPVVSVVTVAYDGAEALRLTLDSVRAQQWDALEHIVIDGGSTDGTVELLEKRDSEIALWRSEPDGGIYDAMNRGLARATGDYVLFLNCGDLLEGSVLFPGRDFGRLLPVRALDYWGRSRLLRLRDLRLGMPYCHQGILFRNQRLVPFDTALRIAADYEFLLANLAQAGLHPSPAAGGGCVVYDTTGVSSTRVLERDLEAARIVRRRFGAYHWLRFWSRQGPKLAIRLLAARQAKRGPP